MLIDERETSGERLQPSGDEAGTAPGDRRFRPDVQGLRAVAVALVVLFHAHVPGLGGGYVGVDVFFVISGFVITGVLLREHASTGSTSILHFYGRRVRRILPAATLVIIAAVIASYALLGPISGAQTAGDARVGIALPHQCPLRVHRHELSVIATSSLGSAELLVARSRRAVLPDLPHDLPRRCGRLATPGAAPSPRRRARRCGGRIVRVLHRPDLEQSDRGVLLSLPAGVGTRARWSCRRLHRPPAPGAGARRSGDVVARPRIDPAGGSGVLAVDVLPRMESGTPRDRSSARHRGRSRRDQERSGESPQVAPVPMDRARLVFALPLALARAHHRGRATRHREPAGLGFAAVGVGVSRLGDRHLLAGGESDSPQRLPRLEEVGQPGPRRVPDRVEPHRGDGRAPHPQHRDAGHPRPGRSRNQRRVSGPDQTGSRGLEGNGPGDHPPGRRQSPSRR